MRIKFLNYDVFVMDYHWNTLPMYRYDKGYDDFLSEFYGSKKESGRLVFNVQEEAGTDGLPHSYLFNPEYDDVLDILHFHYVGFY